MHVFRYSARPGTIAADMPDQVPPEVKEERSVRMRALAQDLARYDARSRIDTVENAVLEAGRPATLASFHRIHVMDAPETTPALVRVAIMGMDESGALYGRVARSEDAASEECDG